MGNSSHISDIKGFEAIAPRKKGAHPLDHDAAAWLCCGLNDGEVEVSDEKTVELLRAIRAIPGGEVVGGVLSDSCSGSGSLGIGWYEEDWKLATPKALEALGKLLKKAGFKIKRLEKDRFMWYG